MASDQGEESRADNASTNRQKRRRSFTGMLRDSLSLLVPSFVMDVSTPKRRRVQEESTASANDRIDTSSSYSFDVFAGPNPSTTRPATVNPLNLPTTSHEESSGSRFRLDPPLSAPQVSSEFRTSHLSVTASDRDLRLNPDVVPDRISSKLRKFPSSHSAAQQPQPGPSRSDIFNSVSSKRPHLNESVAPSSSMLWTQHSESSSSSLLGETYHQSPFYPGKITFGGAAGSRREISRNLFAEKRYQSTVVPMRLTIASRASPGTDDVSESGSSTAEGGPTLSAATRRILKAMRRGSSTATAADSAASHRESLGRPARSVRHQRHALWDSCVRRNTRAAPPTSELRRLPQSTPYGLSQSAVVSSWPRDTIGVPVLGSSASRREPSRSAVPQEPPNFNERPQLSSVFGSVSSFAFSTPASRSQPSTRPPSVASDAEFGQPQFTFPSPPSRSASSNALADMAAPSALPPATSLFNVNSANPSARLPSLVSAQPAADADSLCPNDAANSQSASSTILFSASRTLPEVRPPLNSFSVSFPSTMRSTTKRALPQESWRCESCLAENAFLTSACRTCQRSPSSAVVEAQRKWHVEVNSPPSSAISKIEEISTKNSKCAKCGNDTKGGTQLCDACLKCKEAAEANTNLKWKCESCSLLNDKRCSICSGCNKQKTAAVPGFKAPSTTALPKWQCDVCLVENEETKNACVCCQGSKPKSKSLLEVKLSADNPGKWRCETCFVENDNEKKKCVCCQGPKPKSKSVLEVKLSADNPGKWRCETCFVENDNEAEKCVCCHGPKPKKATQVTGTITSDQGKWRCETCFVENDNEKEKCVCCQGPKPKSVSITLKVGNAEKWRCDTCLVENDASKERCCACEAERPKQNDALTLQSSGKWQCETCLVENKESLDKCPCCESAKPRKKASQPSAAVNGPSKNIFDSGGLLSSWKSSSSGQFKFGSGQGFPDKNAISGSASQKEPGKAAIVFGEASAERSEMKFGASNGGTLKFGSSNSSSSSEVKFGAPNGGNLKIGALNTGSINFGASNGGGLKSGIKGLSAPSNGPILAFGVPKGSDGVRFGANNLGNKPDAPQEKTQLGSSKTEGLPGSTTGFAFGASDVGKGITGETLRSNCLFGKNDGAPGFNLNTSKPDAVVFKFGNKESVEPSKNAANIPSTSASLSLFEVGAKALDSVASLSNETHPAAAASSNFGGKSLFGGVDSSQKSDNAWPHQNSLGDKVARSNKPPATSLNHFPIPQSSFPEAKSIPPSTSIDSLFTNSSKPSMSLKTQDTKVISFGKQSDSNTTSEQLFSGFGSDAKQQKRMVSSVSSPSLNAFGATNNFGSGPGIPSFGQPAVPNSTGPVFNFNKTTATPDGANKLETKEKTSVPLTFGKSSNDSPFMFKGNADQKPANIFGAASQSTQATAEPAASQMGGSGIFGNNAGSTPFMFLGASSDGNPAPTVQSAQSVPVIPTNFQFGQQQSANPASCFVFGNNTSSNSMPPTASVSNPFNPTPSNNRPVKKAIRRIKKN